MTSTTFVDKQTVIQAAWLNDVNTKTYADSSDTVAYTPAGAGAVATTVQTKLRESVSVKDFGALCDGAANDTAAIQLALNSGAKIVDFLGLATKCDEITIPAGVAAINLNIDRKSVV